MRTSIPIIISDISAILMTKVSEENATETERKLTRHEFERLASEITAITFGKIQGHNDGDAEELLFED